MAQVKDYDVVVAGSGAGGLVGALRAAERGFRVLLLEKAPVIGGTAALTGGGLWAPGNPALVAAGVEDTPEAAQTYLAHTVGDRTPVAMQHRYLAEAAPTIAWLQERGIAFRWMQGFPDYHPSEPGAVLTGRAVNPKPLKPERVAELRFDLQPPLTSGDGGPAIRAHDTRGRLWGGQSLVGHLLLACQEAGVTIWTSTAFTDLVLEEGRVVAVRAGEVEIACPAGVLLATGGFEHSPALRAAHQLPEVAHTTWSLGVPGNTGDGHVAGIAAGAATDLLEDAWWTPGFVRPDGGVSFLLWERMAPLGFIVNARGERWINEGLPYNSFGQLMRQGTDCIPSWQVFDQHALDLYGFGGLAPGEDPQPWLDAGVLRRADDLDDLIPRLGRTAERWNVLAEKGVDEDFGRGAGGSYEEQSLKVFQGYAGVIGRHDYPNASLAPLVRGPYYAAPIVLADLGTKGGLVCGEHGEVLRPDGSAIAGLYACGNTMASMMGHAYPGPGSCITPGMTFGRLAADHMSVER